MTETNDTFALIELAQKGDKAACEQLITSNAGLIWSVVRRFFGRGLEADDLYQLGCVGFIKAVRGFDPTYGTQFSTYAVPKIAGEIRRFMRDDGIIKVSRSIKDAASKLSAIRGSLESSLGREPRLSELSEASGMEIEDIAACEWATSSVESLQRQTGDEGLTLESILGTEGIEEDIIEKESLRKAVTLLPDRERAVILLRFFKGLTQERVALVLKVSQVQVSRIERKALLLLREKIG